MRRTVGSSHDFHAYLGDSSTMVIHNVGQSLDRRARGSSCRQVAGENSNYHQRSEYGRKC